MTKISYRIANWPQISDPNQQVGLTSGSTCSARLQLRSANWFSALCMGIRFQAHDDKRLSVEAQVCDLYSADSRELKSLLAELQKLEKAVEAAKSDLNVSYVPESDLAWFLTCLFKRTGIKEIVEYRQTSPDNVIAITPDHVRRLAAQIATLRPFQS